MFRHRHQGQNFRVSEAPLGGSFYSFLLRPHLQYLNVGDLLEYVVAHLWQLTGVRTNRVDFTLVNICSPFTRMSFGSCTEPPRVAWPKGPALILTFATTAMQVYDEDEHYRKKVTSQFVRIHDNNTTQWSTKRGQVDFVSISVGLQDSHGLSLQQPKINELEYLFNLIGPATKSIIRHQTKYKPVGQNYEDVHEALDLKNMHDRVYALPLAQLLTQIPYHLWVFNGELWRRAPNVIPQRLITPAVALYYFMYLTDDIALESSASQDVGLKRLGLLRGDKREGILGHLISSVLTFVQMVKTQEMVELFSQDLLAPSVLAALLRSDSAKLPHGDLYRMHLENDTRSLISQLATLRGDVNRVLFPPEAVAEALMKEDLEYVEAVSALLNGLT